MPPRGRVFDVSTGCVDDGPGLRTVVYLKGCGLDCPWCHNPEGKDPGSQISFSDERCIRCRRCVEACGRGWSFDAPGAWRDGCDGAARCVEACPPGARESVGRDVEAAVLADELIVNRDFFAGTGGGVTFSGGEPLLQPGFLFACARLLRESGVSVAVETAGLWAVKLVPEVVRGVDLVLFDLKHVDAVKMRSVVGQDPAPILHNLAALLAAEMALELRITLVPGFNDSPSDLAALAGWLMRAPRVPTVRLQPFHRMATAKHVRYGTSYPYAHVAPLPRHALVTAAALLSAHGLPVAPETT